jgi:hypothetical protein
MPATHQPPRQISAHADKPYHAYLDGPIGWHFSSLGFVRHHKDLRR